MFSVIQTMVKFCEVGYTRLQFINKTISFNFNLKQTHGNSTFQAHIKKRTDLPSI